MYQLYLVCIVNSFNMKNNFYIDSLDLFHFEGKKSKGFILGEKLSVFIINPVKSKSELYVIIT